MVRQFLFARPGVMSDSWETTGTLLRKAPITTGTATKPPLENTTSGFSSFIIFLASKIPLITLKGSVKFLISKYLLSLPLKSRDTLYPLEKQFSSQFHQLYLYIVLQSPLFLMLVSKLS